jgi:8-oxo-dGTP diphosphatase
MPNHLRSRASCVVFNESCTEVLLVQSSKRPTCWVLPGGGVEDGETPLFAALRELWEEGGCRPSHHSTIPGSPGAPQPFIVQLTAEPVQVKKSSTIPFVTLVGPLEEEYPEKGERKRAWFPLAGVSPAIQGSAVGEKVWGVIQLAWGFDPVMGGEEGASRVILSQLTALKALAAAQ